MTTLGDLTPRELSIASHVARCRTPKQIAAVLGINDRWVRACITSIAFKIRDDDEDGLDDRVRVALWYRERVPISLHGDAA